MRAMQRRTTLTTVTAARATTTTTTISFTSSSCLIGIVLLTLLALLGKQTEVGATTAASAGNDADAMQVTDVAFAMQETKNDNSNNNNNEQSADVDDFEQILEAKLASEAVTSATQAKQLLSRKRRYLVFPEGSSFQLVYDLIIGVVDYTNYLILGVTVALAWELPSKPPSEILEDLRTRLNDGTLGVSRNDTATNITYVDADTLAEAGQAGVGAAHYTPSYINLSAQSQMPATMVAKPVYGNNNNNNHNNKYYYNLQHMFRPPMNQRYDYYYNNNNNKKNSHIKYNNNYGAYIDKYNRRPVAPARRKDAYYYNNNNNYKNNAYSTKRNPFGQWLKPAKGDYYTKYGQTHASSAYPWWQLASRLKQATQRRQDYYRNQQEVPAVERRPDVATGYQQYADSALDSGMPEPKPQPKPNSKPNPQQQQRPPPHRHHRIYPVFGKRSIPNSLQRATRNATSQEAHPPHYHHRQRRSGIAGPELSKLDRIHIRHHRSTRQTLYEKIEKYLDKNKQHGQHCVLRALCETGQKSHERVPGTFIGELLRAVFTLPEALDEEDVAYTDARYDQANAHEGDCATKYHLCQHSMWQADFIK